MEYRKFLKKEPEILVDKSFEIFNLYPVEDVKFFFENSNKLKLVSIRKENLNEYLSYSVVLYSTELNKFFLAPCCLLEKDQKIYYPFIYSKYLEKFIKLIYKGLLRTTEMPENNVKFFFLPPQFEWLKKAVKGLDRYYLCLNDLPTGIHHLKRYRHVLNKIKITKKENITLLEIGHGMGYFQNLLNKDFKYFAFDIDPLIAKLARALDIRNRTHFLDSITPKEEKFIYNFFVVLETLEQVKNPIDFIKNLKDLSDKNSIFFFSVPEEEYGGSHLNYDHISNWNIFRVKRFFSFFFEKLQISYQEKFDFFSKNWLLNSEIGLIYKGRENTESYIIEAKKFKEFDLKNIIVVKRTSAMGDSLLAEPILRKIKEQNPNSLLIFLTYYTEIFKGNSSIDLLVKEKLYGNNFYYFHPLKEFRLINLDFAYESNPKDSIINNYMKVSKVQLFPFELTPRIYLSKNDYRKIVKLIRDILQKYDFKHLVCINIGKKFGKSRTLPPHLVNKLVEALFKFNKTLIIFIGSKDNFSFNEVLDNTLTSKISNLNMSNVLLDLVGKLTLLETAALLSFADFLIAPDTGLVHVASSVGCPTLAFFGLALPEKRVDYTSLVFPIIRRDLKCIGCLHDMFTIDPHCPFNKGNDYPLCLNICEDDLKKEVFPYIEVLFRRNSKFPLRIRINDKNW